MSRKQARAYEVTCTSGQTNLKTYVVWADNDETAEVLAEERFVKDLKNEFTERGIAMPKITNSNARAHPHYEWDGVIVAVEDDSTENED